jgi:hypothetical protein
MYSNELRLCVLSRCDYSRKSLAADKSASGSTQGVAIPGAISLDQQSVTLPAPAARPRGRARGAARRARGVPSSARLARRSACFDQQAQQVATRAWLDCAPDFRGKQDALGQNAPQSGPKCQGGGGITAYAVRPHAPDASRACGRTTYAVIPPPSWHLGPNRYGFDLGLKLLEAKIVNR